MGSPSRKPVIESNKSKSEPVLDTRLPADPTATEILPKRRILSPGGKDDIEVSQEVFESIEETASILSDPQLLKDIETGRRQTQTGNSVSWKSIKAKLGL